jgi:hypothetical protein
MSDSVTKEKEEQPAAAPRTGAEDLSKEIELHVERQPGEHLRTVRVFGDYYRCNWWVQDKTPHPSWLVTGTISKSRFLHATKTAAGLVIEDLGTHLKRS